MTDRVAPGSHHHLPRLTPGPKDNDSVFYGYKAIHFLGCARVQVTARKSHVHTHTDTRGRWWTRCQHAFTETHTARTRSQKSNLDERKKIAFMNIN